MRAYWRLGQMFAVYVEISKEVGHKPLCCIQKFNNELIVEIPYCTAILTPGRRLRAEYTHMGYREKPNEKRNRRLSTTTARVTKN